MENLNLDTPLGPVGLALIAVGAFLAIKAIKGVVKLGMLVVIAVGVYLVFFAGR